MKKWQEDSELWGSFWQAAFGMAAMARSRAQLSREALEGVLHLHHRMFSSTHHPDVVCRRDVEGSQHWCSGSIVVLIEASPVVLRAHGIQRCVHSTCGAQSTTPQTCAVQNSISYGVQSTLGKGQGSQDPVQRHAMI